MGRPHKLFVTEGQQFDRLVVIVPNARKITPGKQRGVPAALCQCACGKQTTVPLSALISADIKSCGCRRAENARKSGERRIVGTCDVCGGPLRSPGKLGVCAQAPECRRERERRVYARDPQRKRDSAMRWYEAGRPEREQKAAERAQTRAAELESTRAQVLELRSLGWSQDAIRAELQCGTPLINEVLKGVPAQTCRICGGPMKASMSARSSGRYKSDTGICERNPECRRKRVQFSTRFRAIREFGPDRQPTDLTIAYLVSIWTGRCVRTGCGKVLGEPGCPRDDAATLDRIIPADGYMQGNVRWLCGRCNRWKQDMTSVEMRAMLLDQVKAEARKKALADLALQGKPADPTLF